MGKFNVGDHVKIYYPFDIRYYNTEGHIYKAEPGDVQVIIKDSGDILQIPFEAANKIIRPIKKEDSSKLKNTTENALKPLKEEGPLKIKDAANLVAKMFNEVEYNDRDNWTGEEIFNASPTGEVFFVLEYYRLAKEFFELDEEDRKSLKISMTVKQNGTFAFTVPSTWKHYRLTQKEIVSILNYAVQYKNHPEDKPLTHFIKIGDKHVSHSQKELMALFDYLKGDIPDEIEKSAEEVEQKYQVVSECPNPYVGLEWTELYSYYGKVVAEINRSLSFDWQEQDRDWRGALEETYYVIEDTAQKAPYILTAEQFKRKFTYSKENQKCWVRFKFN